MASTFFIFLLVIAMLYFMGIAYQNMRSVGFNDQTKAFRITPDGEIGIFDFTIKIPLDSIVSKIKSIREFIYPGYLKLFEYIIFSIKKAGQAISDIIIKIIS